MPPTSMEPLDGSSVDSSSIQNKILTNGAHNIDRRPDVYPSSHNGQSDKLRSSSGFGKSIGPSANPTTLRQSVITTRAKFIQLSVTHVNGHYLDSITSDGFQDYIKSVRLFDMPQQGSRWDRALNWAERFAEQVSQYEDSIIAFIPEIKVAARLIWAACRVLIEIGVAHCDEIEKAFAVFYKAGLSLSFIPNHDTLISQHPHIQTELGDVFNDLLLLVRDVTLHSRIHIHSRTLTSEVGLFFRSSINNFYLKRSSVIESMWGSVIGDQSISFHTIRSWLMNPDYTIRTILRDRASESASSLGSTCEWMRRPFLDFSRGNEDVLVITGESGCGKSRVSAWLAERLQTQVGKKRYATISVTQNSDLPTECTSLAITQNIARQLLRINIGDLKYLKALWKSYRLSLEQTDLHSLETSLWDAIHIGLHNSEAEHLMIVIDGLDDRCGHQIATSISKRVHKLASEHPRVKAVITARNASHVPKGKTQVLPITPDLIHNDLKSLVENKLRQCQQYLLLKEQQSNEVVESLVHTAAGNFLWVKIMIRLLRSKESHEILKAVKLAKESPKSVGALIRELIRHATSDLSQSDSTQLLSWLLASKRPLTIHEITGLLRVNLQKKNLSAVKKDVEDYVTSLCGSLVSIRNGIVSFSHTAIREQLSAIAGEGKILQKTTSLQTDFVTRILAFCKLSLTEKFDPVFECPAKTDLETLFHRDALLEYVARYWIFHFTSSSLYNDSGTLVLSEQFKALFPSSGQLAMLEWVCWRTQMPIFEAGRLHALSLDVRRSVFNEKHESVFQSLVVCGNVYRSISSSQEASTYFYRAFHLGQSIFESHSSSSVTLSCTTAFLEIARTIKCTTRTEIATRREELLLYVVAVYEKQFGSTSDLVIQYSRELAEFYVSIHEEHKAEVIFKRVREVLITRYGKSSVEVREISECFSSFFESTEETHDFFEYETELLGSVMELEIWDITRIEIFLKLAWKCEVMGDLLKTEEYYIMLWHSLIEHYHIGIDVYISLLKVTLKYVEFLRRHHRYEESCAILICVWAEFEEFHFESETLFIQLRILGEVMRSVSLLSIAISVFKKCSSWFKFHEKHEEVSQCQILISETIEEITTTQTVSTTSTTTTTTNTTVSSTELVIKEMFESSISKSVVTIETITICRSLVSMYMRQEQWSEAIKITERSLELVWRAVLSVGGTIALPRHFASEAIELAISLALCHHRSHHFHEAEMIYLQIYRACSNSCQVTDERFTRSFTLLIGFYEEHLHWDRVIGVYRDILVVTRKHHGDSHKLTIELLYKLAHLCHKHGHGHAHEFYEEIIVILNANSKVCHHSALSAMEFMCRIYYESGQWQKLKHTCEILWETWVNHHSKYKIEAHFIELLYIRYIYVLRHHIQAGYEIIRSITLQYRNTCLVVFGASISITVKALVELATICMEREEHVHEAIEYYEEIIKTTTTVSKSSTTTTIISETTLATIKQSLTTAYTQICSHSTVASTVIERAITVMIERLEYLKVTFGCSHTETLTVVRNLVLMYRRLKTKESLVTATHVLLEATILIVTKEKRSKYLFEAAKTIAGIYLECGMYEEGRNLLSELHCQIISRSYTSAGKCGFTIDKSVGRESYVFLVTYEEVLRGSRSISYSKTMTELLIENILYESYTRCIKSEKNIEIVLSTCAKYFVFLEKSSRQEQLLVVQDQLFQIFMKKWGTVIKSKTEITMAFLLGLLRSLGSGSHDIHVGNSACTSSNEIVQRLLISGEYYKAHELASCAFQFIQHQKAYHHLQKNVRYGFKFSSLMALRGVSLGGKSVDPELRSLMMELSVKIIKEVLKACKDNKVNFVQMKPNELNDLVGLLGEQKNYTELELILKTLWNSREDHKHWSRESHVSISKRLVQAHFLGSHDASKAIQLCERICHNVRTVYSPLHRKALSISALLAQIYTEANKHHLAMRIHEEILRLIVEGDDDDDGTVDEVDAKTAHKHLHLLRQSYLRLQRWDKDPNVYKDLINQLLSMPEYKNSIEFKGEMGFDKWSLKDKLDDSDKFVAPLVWEFLDPKSLREICDAETEKEVLGQRKGVKRVVSTWGMNMPVVGSDELPMTPKLPNGNGSINGGSEKKGRGQYTLM